MKRLLIQMPVTIVAFCVGVSAVSFFWGPLTRHAEPPRDVTEIDAPAIYAPAVTAPRIENVLKTTAKKIDKKRVPINRHISFEDVILRLKRLAVYMKADGEQTFYISAVENGDTALYARAYWKQKNAIIVLQLPMYGEPGDGELFWLSGKAYTDLNEDVVPKELDNMGCCSVTKAWADNAVKACKAGYKLKFSVDAQAE